MAYFESHVSLCKKIRNLLIVIKSTASFYELTGQQ